MGERMPRLKQVDVSSLTGRPKELLEGIKKKRGYLPPLFLTLANSPASLGGYLAFGSALASSSLSAQLRERISIAVAATSKCHHCLEAHTKYGRDAGLSEEELVAARGYSSADPLAEAALTFARAVQETRGRMPDAAMAAARAAGLHDAHMVDIAAVVAVNLFSNYVNNLGEHQ